VKHRPSIDQWPDLDTAKRDYTFGELWILGSQYADLLNAALEKKEMFAALKLAYPLLTDKAAREEIMELLNRIEGK
jgi:hypothetical protein